ncbi:hypothetical protein NDU88_011532, partial [Pleurodeles waltl]
HPVCCRPSRTILFSTWYSVRAQRIIREYQDFRSGALGAFQCIAINLLYIKKAKSINLCRCLCFFGLFLSPSRQDPGSANSAS